MSRDYRDAKTGQLVRLAGPVIDGQWVQVAGLGGVRMMKLADLEEIDAATGLRTKVEVEEAPEPTPEPTPGIIETRLNINVADVDSICRYVKGIGYSTAKRIVELRDTLPECRFRNLDQLRSIGRVNWDAIFADNKFYIG